MAEAPSTPSPRSGRYLLFMAVGALGVVYGDIGTSPLYALRECFHGPGGLPPTRENVLGVLSLVFWSLIVVISIKYLGFILRADNRGEGGILALMALLLPGRGAAQKVPTVVVAMGLFGAALLYGDGAITPAISVLSAVEGLEVATPVFRPIVIPLVLVILVGLFAVQRHGTARVGSIFGPVTLVWFLSIGILGLSEALSRPEVFRSVDPSAALAFFARNGRRGFLVLGAVVLVVTGGEALYADMGHFGKRAIRIAWFAVVLPALMLNYFGQGALLLSDPGAARNPFYLLVPGWALYPMVALATAAAVIASQAVISGAFSLSRQAVQLGYLPRLAIQHTSQEEMGQIYVPQINWLLMFATLGLVLGFRTSSNLAGAYGVAVTATMGLTTVLFCIVARQRWGWGLPAILSLGAAFLVVDLAFLGATLTKIAQGGWFPLVLAAGVYVVMTTWKRGREILIERLSAFVKPLDQVLRRLASHPPHRVAGTAIFLTSNPSGTSSALIQNLKHNKILHRQVALLTLQTKEVPRVPSEGRLEIENLGQGFYRIRAWYGFMEHPDVPHLLRQCRKRGFVCRIEETTFFVARETLLATERPGMAIWREKLFALLSRNAERATTFFRIPTDRVIEVGCQIEL